MISTRRVKRAPHFLVQGDKNLTLDRAKSASNLLLTLCITHLTLFGIHFCLWTGLSLGLVGPLAAGEPPPFPPRLNYGASTLGFAGTSAAMASGHDAISTNPAGLMYLQGVSSIGGEWSDPPGNGRKWSASIIDGSSDIIGGLRFSWTNWKPASRQQYQFALAYKTPWVVAGVSGEIAQMRNVSSNKGWHFTNGLGVLIPLHAGLTVGAFSKSLLDMAKDSVFPPAIHLGIMYAKVKSFRVGFDADRLFQTPGADWNYSTGAEFLLREFFVIRGGFHWDAESGQNYWAVGGGMLAPKIDLVGSFVQTTANPIASGFVVETSIRF